MPKWKSDPKDGLVPVDYAAALIYSKQCKQDGRQVPTAVVQLIAEGEVVAAKAIVAEQERIKAEAKTREAEHAALYEASKKEKR